jgi:hypothetical protein
MPRNVRVFAGLTFTLWMLVAAVALVNAQSPEGGAWLQAPVQSAPPARFDHALVAAPDFNRLVLFGGQDSARMNDTWIYEIATGEWRQVVGNVAPPIRSGMGSAYDALRGRVLIFGGEQPGVLNDTWAFDMASETWSEIPATGAIPEARYGTSGTYDAEADQFIITHGFANGRFDNTYALDLTTNAWTNISPQNRPLARCLHDVAYDPVNRKMILFGGCSNPAGPCPIGDLWSFDLLSGIWTEVNDDATSPAARMNTSLSSDDDGIIWMFGGDSGNGSLNDFWSLDALTGTWTLHDASAGPAARRSHDAAWDSENGLLWVFGGRGDSGAMNDLWVYTPGDM